MPVEVVYPFTQVHSSSRVQAVFRISLHSAACAGVEIEMKAKTERRTAIGVIRRMMRVMKTFR